MHIPLSIRYSDNPLISLSLSIPTVKSGITGFTAANSEAALDMGGRVNDSYPPPSEAIINKFTDFLCKLTDLQALAALSAPSGAFSGIYVRAKSNRIRPIVLTRQASLLAATSAINSNDDDGPTDTKKIILGNGSNYPRVSRPVFVEVHAVKSIIVLAKASDLDDSHLPQGDEFTKESAPKLAEFIDDNDADVAHVLARIRCLLPIIPGTPVLQGDQADTIHSGLSQIHMDAARWLSLIYRFDAKLHAFALEHKSELGKLFPKTGRGIHFREDNSSPTVVVESVGDEHDEALADHLAAIQEELTGIMQKNLRDAAANKPPLDEVNLSSSGDSTYVIPRKAKSEDDKSLASSHANITAAVPVLCSSASANAAATVPEASKQALRRAKIMLYAANLSADSYNVVGPVFHQEGHDFIMATDSKVAASLLESNMLTWQKNLTRKKDSIYRLMGLSSWTPAMYTHFANAEFRKHALRAVHAIGDKSGFCAGYCLPPTLALSQQEEASAQDNERRLQLQMGEDSRRVNSVNTAMNTAKDIEGGLQSLITFFLNIKAFFIAFVVCQDPKDDKGTSQPPPFLYFAADKLLDAITDFAFRQRFERVYEDQPHLPYTIFAWFITMEYYIFEGISQFARDIVRNDWGSVNPSMFKHPHRQLDTYLNYCFDFAHGANSIIVGDMYTKSPRYTLEQKKQEAATLAIMKRNGLGTKRGAEKALGDTRDPKRQSTIKDEISKVGWLIVDLARGELLPLPHIKNKNEIPCAPGIRDGFTCKMGDKCKYCHKKPDQLTGQSFQIWLDWVEKHDFLTFNEKVISHVNCLEVNERKKYKKATAESKAKAEAAKTATKAVSP